MSTLWHKPGNILSPSIDNCSITKYVSRFRYEDNNVHLMSVQPHCYRVQQVQHCHRLGGVARHSSLSKQPMIQVLRLALIWSPFQPLNLKIDKIPIGQWLFWSTRVELHSCKQRLTRNKEAFTSTQPHSSIAFHAKLQILDNCPLTLRRPIRFKLVRQAGV